MEFFFLSKTFETNQILDNKKARYPVGLFIFDALGITPIVPEFLAFLFDNFEHEIKYMHAMGNLS